MGTNLLINVRTTESGAGVMTKAARVTYPIASSVMNTKTSVRVPVAENANGRYTRVGVPGASTVKLASSNTSKMNVHVPSVPSAKNLRRIVDTVHAGNCVMTVNARRAKGSVTRVFVTRTVRGVFL